MKCFIVVFALLTVKCVLAIQPDETMSVEVWMKGTCSEICGGGQRIDFCGSNCLGHVERTLPCNTKTCIGWLLNYYMLSDFSVFLLKK